MVSQAVFFFFLVCCALKCFLFEADMLVLMNLQLLSRKYNSHGAHFHVTQLCIYIWMCVFPLQYNGFKSLRSEIPCIFLTSWIYPMSMLCLFFESQLWLNRVDLKWLLKCVTKLLPSILTAQWRRLWLKLLCFTPFLFSLDQDLHQLLPDP